MKIDFDAVGLETGVCKKQLVMYIKMNPNKHPMWCGYFALSKGFACRPRFSDLRSAQYADDRFKDWAERTGATGCELNVDL